MQQYLVFILLLNSTLALCQAYPDSIYNDDPLQKVPMGVEEASHRIIEAKGAVVDQARIHPPNWWVGMAHPRLELLIYDQDIRDFDLTIDYPGINVRTIKRLENPNYLFVELELSEAIQAGQFEIQLKKGEEKRSYSYELKEKATDKQRIQGLTSADLMYLIMPDRFANGDRSNDSFSDLEQVGIHRDKVFFRHGGDLIGVMEHLDYVQQLGVTAIWLNPVLENDQAYESYHGYAITDHYQVDPRFGRNEQYRYLADICQARGIKLIKDIIHNHVGDQHWFIKDLPSKDWIHQFDAFTKTSYRAPTLMDPYASEADKEIMLDGWFDHHMPDLNQKQPQLANYLIQNHIWWIEYAGIDGYRIDTYAYNDPTFMSEWALRIKKEYPDFSIFGETWVHGAPIQAQFTQNNNLREGFNSNLPGVTDFQLYYAILEALEQEQGWTSGVAKIYFTLAKDFLYEDPYRNVLFLDNHDLARLYTVLENDINKFKSGIALIMTLRGIPMLYYGTEILLTGSGGGAFGEAGRKDFPGGWAEDRVNKFYAQNRTAEEQAAFEYIRTLGLYRKNTPALQNGKLTQFVPEDGIYVFFRYDEDKTVMVLTNSNNAPKTVSTQRYAECMAGFSNAKDIISGQTWSIPGTITIERNSTIVLELGK